MWTWLGTGPNVESAGLSVGASGSGASSAANGGFVLYPNKSNTNMMTAVYSKK